MENYVKIRSPRYSKKRVVAMTLVACFAIMAAGAGIGFLISPPGGVSADFTYGRLTGRRACFTYLQDPPARYDVIIMGTVTEWRGELYLRYEEATGELHLFESPALRASGLEIGDEIPIYVTFIDTPED